MSVERWNPAPVDRFARWSLRYSILLPLLFLLTFASLAEYCLEVAERSDRLFDRTREADTILASYMGRLLRPGGPAVSIEQLHRNLADWTDRDRALGVLITDGAGDTLAESVGEKARLANATVVTRNQIKDPTLPGRVTIQTRQSLQAPAATGAIAPEPVPGHEVVLERDITEELRALRVDVLNQIASRTLVYLVLLILVWMLFDRLIRRRVEQIVHSITENKPVPAGRLALTIGNDEIAVLGRVVQEKLGELDAQQLQLAEQTQKLQASKAQFLSLRTAIDSHAVVSMTDLAGNIVFANDRFCQLSGYTSAELLGQSHRLLNSGAHAPEVFAGLWEKIAGGEAWHGQLQNRSKAGKPYWVQLTILPVKSADASGSHYLAIQTDITLQARLRTGLEIIAGTKRNESVFSAIVEGLAYALDVCAIGIGVLKEDGRTISLVGHWVDGAPGPLLDYDARQTLCAYTLDFPDDEIHVIEGDDLDRSLIHPLQRDRGIVSHRGRCLKDATGKIIGVIFVIDDKLLGNCDRERGVLNIAARRAEAELIMAADVRSLRDYRQLMVMVGNVVNLAVWDWNIATDELHFTPPDAVTYPRDPDERGGPRTRLEVVVPEDRERHRQDLIEHLAGRTEFFNSVSSARTDAGLRTFLSRGQVVARDADGRALRMVGVIVDQTEQAREKAELQIERDRVAMAVDGAGLGTWDWNIETGAVETNELWWRMFGREPWELPSTIDTWTGLVHPEDIDAAWAAANAHLRGETPLYAVEFRQRAKDGQWVWVLDSGRVTRRDADGKPVRMSGIHLDITERKLAEAKVLDRERKLKLVVQAGRTGFWDWNLETNELELYEDGYDTFGLAGTEHMAANLWLGRLAEADRGRFHQNLIAHFKQQTPIFECEVRYQSQTRGELNILSRGEVVARDSHGRALRMIGVHVDITRLRDVERDLRESSLGIEFVSATANIGIWDWNIASMSMRANTQMFTMLGYPPAAETNTEAWVQGLLHPDDLSRVVSLQRAQLRGELAELSLEVRFKGANGEWIWVLSVARVVTRDAGGRAVRMLGIHLNINEIKQAAAARELLETQLLQAQKMEALGQLTGGIAHDFNNILASVLGYSVLAREKFAVNGPPKLKEYLDAVILASERARDLVVKMLAFSRNLPRQALVPVLVAPALREALGMLSATIPSSIQISSEIEDEGVAVIGDPTEFHQMIVNLAINARDAMNGTGRIVVRVSAARNLSATCASCRKEFSGDFVDIEMEDSGPGIAPEYLTRLFDPFFTTKEIGKGTGLGLSVVHGIVHNGDGHICVISTPGQGASFHLYLRSAKPEVEGQRQSPEQ